MNPKDWEIYSWLENLSQEQKKIIYLSLIGLGFLLAFWFFVYAPQARKFSQIKNALRQAEGEISKIMELTQGRDMALAVQGLEQEFLLLAKRLPSQDEQAVRILSEIANKFNVEVANISPSGQKPVDVNIPGYEIKELPLSVSLSGEYKAIGEFLGALRDSASLLTRLRQVDISSQAEGNPRLSATVQISAYLSSERR